MAKPVIVVTEISDLHADLRWWRQATPAQRIAGVESARRDWLKMSRSREVTEFNHSYEDLIALLNQHQARYLIVGGYAVAWHVGPRFTKDIDFFVEPTLDNARRVLVALEAFIGDPGITPERFISPRTLLMIGVPPTRVDIMTSVDGVESFQSAWERRVNGAYGEQEACYFGLEDLVASKRAAGRPQDLADLTKLEQLKSLSNDDER